MVDIDLKDRKILYELDLNSRQSDAQIARKVGLSKQVTTYRIKRMQDEGIITCFWTAINTLKLGYYCFRIYINFLNVGTDIKNEIIGYFENHKRVWALLSAKGPVDLDVVLWVDDIFEFNQFWNNTLDKYGNYFEKYALSILNQVTSLKISYLFLDDYKKTEREFYVTSGRGDPITIDNIDYQLLNEIALNARIPLIELAKKLNCSSKTINYHLKNLMKNNIIQAFRVGINNSKLGLQNCSIEIYIKDYSKRRQIFDYLKSNPYVFDIMDMTIGWSDFAIELMTENIDTLNRIMEDIEKKFPNAIRKMNIWMWKKVYKERWLPEMTKGDFKKVLKSI